MGGIKSAEAKERKRAYDAAYRERNKERSRAYHKAYREITKERKKAVGAAYRERTKERRKAYNKEWREQNKERKKSADAVYRGERKEESKCYHIEYYQKNKERLRVRAAAYYQKTKPDRRRKSKEYYEKNKKHIAEWTRNRRLKLLYDLTSEQWVALFESQSSCCAICKSEDPRSKRGWATDHDHETGEVRGILCMPCNLALGAFGDSTETVKAAAAYLERASDSEAEGVAT